MEEQLSLTSHFHFVRAVEVRHKREVDMRWEQGQVTLEKYSVAVQSCRDGVGKAKVHLELNLARNAKDNRKAFYNYMNCKRKM